MPSKAHCGYYNLPIRVIEDPEFAFTCDRMNFEKECPPDCRDYNLIDVVRKEAIVHGR